MNRATAITGLFHGFSRKQLTVALVFLNSKIKQFRRGVRTPVLTPPEGWDFVVRSGDQEVP
jgi:hypothetical protein